jgi:O-antigen/teichoic acid export membrane protein
VIDDRGQPPAAVSAAVNTVARGSVVNVAAMVTGATLGFALTVVVGRWLQPRGAGALFELFAIFSILSNTLELGADTGLTRWISRAGAIGELAVVRRVIGIAIVPVLLVGALAAAIMWVTAPEIARTFLHGMAPGAAELDVRIIAAMVPLGALSSCILAGPRGFGRMWPYLAIEGVGKPVVRIGLVLAALLAGWGLQGALLAWCLPIAVGLVAASLILASLIRKEAPARGRRATPSRARPKASPGPGDVARARGASTQNQREAGRHRGSARAATLHRRLAGEFWGFAGPRAFAGTFQIIVVWLDVLLVGALVSGYAAGVYGALSKLAVVGTFALEGTRLAIAPQLSALLARKERAAAADLYQTSTRWLMLAGWPMYVLFAIFPAVVLGIFGHRYAAGATSLVVLSLSMLINLGTGNVTVVLLMGGKSSWNVVNSLAALIVNVGLNVVLLPRIGILGAAIAWAAAIVVDNVAAVIEVKCLLGLAPFGAGYVPVIAAAAGSFGAAAIGMRMLLGESLPALLCSGGIGLAIYVLVIYLARSRLRLVGLIDALWSRRSSPAGIQPSQRTA